MGARKPTVALMYDFDKTLCTKDMQEYTFIPKLGIESQTFWNESTALSKEQKMDRILAYMYLMIDKSNTAHQSIHREDFVKLGKDVEFFDGVITWFDRINQYGKEQGVAIEHYIISSGLKEIIEGSQIKKYFKEIYACEFHYNVNGVADWPLLSVNYTAKTQFLFRINKGILDISNDDDLNKFVKNDERRIPFRNMIYIGDGLTDVPCMKLVKLNGGHSIAVYQRNKGKVKDLLLNDRVDFVAPANYMDGSELDSIMKSIIDQISISNNLLVKQKKQVRAFRPRQIGGGARKSGSGMK